MIDHSLFVLIPNSEGRNLGQTLSEVAMTEEANRVPIIQASFNVFPYVNPVATPAKNASPAPVVSFTSTFLVVELLQEITKNPAINADKATFFIYLNLVF